MAQKAAKGKKAGRIVKWVAAVLGLLLLAVLLVVTVARVVNGVGSRIGTENGIDENAYVEIGGINQYLNIRGQDTENPVVLFLHGGPGSPMSFLAYSYQTELESDFTFVHWDQRGSGRTYYENKNAENQPELTVDLLLSDIDEIVDYLCERFEQQKVIVMGHSWGTVLGTLYAQQHPGKVAAYVGVCQVVNGLAGDILALETAAGRAEGKGENEDAAAMRAMAGELKTRDAYDVDSFLQAMEMRPLMMKYMAFEGETTALKTMWLGIASPDMWFRDLGWFLGTSTEVLVEEQGGLLEALFGFSALVAAPKLEVPAYYICGEEDWITPTALIEDYFEDLEAPQKQRVQISNAGHMIMADAPELFCDAVREVLADFI